MFDKKEYMKKWRKENPKEEEKKRYYKENQEKYIKRAKKWDEEHSLRLIEKSRKSSRKWQERNQNKVKSQRRARYQKLKGKECKMCGSKEKLEFHHTEYENDKGFTLCGTCHRRIHRRVNVAPLGDFVKGGSGPTPIGPLPLLK